MWVGTAPVASRKRMFCRASSLVCSSSTELKYCSLPVLSECVLHQCISLIKTRTVSRSFPFVCLVKVQASVQRGVLFSFRVEHDPQHGRPCGGFTYSVVRGRTASAASVAHFVRSNAAGPRCSDRTSQRNSFLLIERLEFGWKSPHALSASTFASSCLLGFLRLAARGFFFGFSTTGVGTSESSTEGRSSVAVANSSGANPLLRSGRELCKLG